MSQPFSLKRQENDTSISLDALRAFAAQAVCVGHSFNLFLGGGTTYLPHFGVLLFFALSGFVIAHTLESKAIDPSYGLMAFVVERGARIYTAYLPALVLIAVLDVGLGALGSPPSEVGWSIWWRNLLMLQNYVGPLTIGAPTYGSAGQLSSVAAEWHIYVFVGALYFFFRGRNRLLCLLVAWVAAAQPLGYFRALPDSDRALFVIWVLGFGAYYVARAVRLDAWSTFLAAASLPVLVTVWVRQRIPGAEYSIDHFPLLIFALLALVLGTQGSRIFTRQRGVADAISGLASYAFSLFLLHFTIQKMVLALFPEGGVLGALCAVALSNLAARVFAELTEVHYRRVAKWLLGLMALQGRRGQWAGDVPMEGRQ